MDFAFEDDLFEPVKQRKSFENTVNDAIKKYVAKSFFNLIDLYLLILSKFF